MKAVIEILEERISAVMAESAGQKAPAIVGPATSPEFGDYQANGVMALAKQIKTNPRKLAEQIVEKLESATADRLSDICEPPEIAGPGFINLRLKPGFVAANLLEISKDTGRLGIDKTTKPQTIVVDFSGPNIAKQMHVGHLRSTIIGDCICRMLEFTGHKIKPQNHVGDWGLQMGMIMYTLVASLLKQIGSDSSFKSYNEYTMDEFKTLLSKANLTLDDLERSYRIISEQEKKVPELANQIRIATRDLQYGQEILLSLYDEAYKITLKECYRLYQRLGVKLDSKDTCGESFYADKLATVVEDLKNKGLAKESDGAICVFPEGFKNKQGEPQRLVIQKSDGAYLYATTDLAAIRYRVNELKADKIIYVTDARQKLHFEMVFAVARMAGWVSEKVDLAHVTFGSVLGENGKPLKTREGENVKLKELLKEAVERARTIVEEKNPDLSDEKKTEIAEAVGIGAVKYADYSTNRDSDYIFSFDKMLAMEGNTAPYMQYAYARIKSIQRKADERNIDFEKELKGIKELNLTEQAEIELAKHLIRYGEALSAAEADYRPNYITAYLYDLAQKFSSFYNACPVLDAGKDKRPTRLLLCELTARTTRHGLEGLLGIEVVEQM
jgi:arginyl-tRNA synthetase